MNKILGKKRSLLYYLNIQVIKSQPRPQLIEERYRYRHYGGQKDEDPAKDRPTSTAPPPCLYLTSFVNFAPILHAKIPDIPRPSPAPVPPQPNRSHAIHGGDSGTNFLCLPICCAFRM